MNWFFPIYWLIGCLVVGAALHDQIVRCPNKQLPSPQDIAATIVVWGAVVYPTIKGVKPNTDLSCSER